MRIAVLGATGLTGRALTTQALSRGYQVTTLARDPARLQDLACPALTLARANIRDPESVYAAVKGADALVSGLGVGAVRPARDARRGSAGRCLRGRPPDRLARGPGDGSEPRGRGASLRTPPWMGAASGSRCLLPERGLP